MIRNFSFAFSLDVNIEHPYNTTCKAGIRLKLAQSGTGYSGDSDRRNRPLDGAAAYRPPGIVMQQDVRELIARRPMTGFQIGAVLVCQAINILDGFDVVIISYAGPLLAQEWDLPPERLGVVFSAGLFGMTVGAFVLAPLADYIGRRKTIVAGLVIVTLGMLLTPQAGNAAQIAAARVLTGLGIGALFAGLTALVVEYSSAKRRTLAVSVLYLGYPIGATLGGLIAQYNIERMGWRTFFLYGGVMTGALIPAALWKLPESLDYLLSRQPKNALAEANRLIRKLRCAPIDVLPPKPAAANGQPVKLLFSAEYKRRTALLWVSFFASLLVIYFLISWTPQILIGAGLPLERSILGGMLLNAGGGAGMLVLGVLASRHSLRRLIGIYFSLGAVFMAVFALSSASLPLLTAVTAGIGFFTYSSLIGLYALAAQQYPPSARSTGVGWAIGVGRIGSIAGPYAAGLMIGWGWERSTYYLVLAAPLLIGAAAVFSTSAARGASPVGTGNEAAA